VRPLTSLTTHVSRETLRPRQGTLGDWISASCLPPATRLIASSLWSLGHGGAVDLSPPRWEGSAPFFVFRLKVCRATLRWWWRRLVQ
jgi:hypothetical protein